MSPEAAKPTKPSYFDWGAAHRRLRSIAEAIDSDRHTDPETQRRILERRAAAFAVPPTGDAEGEVLDLLGFAVGDHRYCLPVDQVEEVAGNVAVIPVPGIAGSILGVISHRGSILAVADINPLLWKPGVKEITVNSVFVVSIDRIRMGIAVQEIFGLAKVPAADILPTQATMESEDHAAIRGFAPDSWLVLDANYLVRDARLVIDDDVTSARTVREVES